MAHNDDNTQPSGLHTYHHTLGTGLEDFDILAHVRLPSLLLVEHLSLFFCLASCRTNLTSFPSAALWPSAAL